MLTDLRPHLRAHVRRVPDACDPRFGYLVDELRQSPEPLRLSRRELHWLEWFDGQRSIHDIRAAIKGQMDGGLVPVERLLDLTRRLDDALLLEGQRWRQHIARPVREPSCIGCYDADADQLTQDLKQMFEQPGGPGLPHAVRADDRLRAALVPHIDYARAGVSYAWGFKEVFEHTAAGLFIIVGTSHYSTHRFTLTRKNFKTPLGTVPTDQQFIDRLVSHYGDGLFDDELAAHLPEHSIELEVVFLQWFYGSRRPIRIVPLVVGSFQDATTSMRDPAAYEDIGRMLTALRCAEAETPEPVCYLISGDLAHIGPHFVEGRSPVTDPVTDQELAHSRRQDQVLLDKLEGVDTAGFFQVIAKEKDKRAICGLPPAFTVLAATRPRRGLVLHYNRYVHPTGFESVSFASMAFYK